MPSALAQQSRRPEQLRSSPLPCLATRQCVSVSWLCSLLQQAPMRAALQAFLQQERHPGMDLIGATLKYEMDLRDLRAAENLSQSKLLFFWGPQARRSHLLLLISTRGHALCMLAASACLPRS